ncbi:MAG: hypoxanthine phosphoribosyltransferase [Acidimicrobiia bacterium]|nr:hypoxanthine phosphoribosyltransferase [Acidimicrobiia bacterium]MYC58533.1 hypoxanthine phosphoribosyltransferase [Acidimicrobiia bacterium]MYG94291.1 hypoxanthine phosphoribosyltransferase [Acidimicrobiia bacterium]MYI30360.1 hypoxanthine phosphoribosyltransferase [Acidimicrobiia bacterium]
MQVAPLKLFASKNEIAAAVVRVAQQISAERSNGTVLVSVLKGSLLFLADLAKALDIEVEIDFLALNRFAPDSGRVRLLKDLNQDVTGREIVLVEGIVDTGLSLNYLVEELQRRSAASVSVATLLDRKARRILPLVPDYVAFEVPDEFFLGYGLDWLGRYRNLQDLFICHPASLAADPDAFVSVLY